MSRPQSIFVVWNPFQRRAQSIARRLGLAVFYYHFPWEEKSRVLKAASYILKFLATLIDLFRHRPRHVFIQLAPTPILYAAYLYHKISGTGFVADCHNTMIYDAWWIRWPFAKSLLKKSMVTIVHNADVKCHADRLGIETLIVPDPLPRIKPSHRRTRFGALDITRDRYVIIPCGMAVDEPILPLFDAASQHAELVFMMTWFEDRIPRHIKQRAPANLFFSGYLDEPDFNTLYANAFASLVLSTREGTQPSGAAEAIALGIPLVISDLATTRRLYGDAPVFVKNDARSIADGISQVSRNHTSMITRIGHLRQTINRKSGRQLDVLAQKLEAQRG